MKYQRFRKSLNRAKRLLAAVIGASMIITSVGSTTVWAMEVPDIRTEADEEVNSEETNTSFVFDKEELSQALLKAVKGKSVKENALSFDGDEAETYDDLFTGDGYLFELHPEMEKTDDKMDVKVYARLDADEETDLENYTITGNEEIVTLPSLKDETVEKTDADNSVVEETKEETGETSEETSKKEPDETKTDESGKDEPPKDEAVKNPDTTQNPESGEVSAEVKKKDPVSKEDDKDSEGSSDESAPKETDQKDADKNNENQNASGQESENPQVSRSEHFQMFLMETEATPGEITKNIIEPDETTDDRLEESLSNQKPEVAGTLTGEVYESVLLKSRAAAVFVTTAAALGLSDSAEISVSTFEELKNALEASEFSKNSVICITADIEFDDTLRVSKGSNVTIIGDESQHILKNLYESRNR